MDKSDTQLLMARENCQFAKADNIQLIHGDALGMCILILICHFLGETVEPLKFG